MNGELLILFVILLLALILCSFLGGNCGKEGMENGQTYNGPNGASAQIQTDSNGNNSLVVTNSSGTTTISTSSSNKIIFNSKNKKPDKKSDKMIRIQLLDPLKASSKVRLWEAWNFVRSRPGAFTS